MTAGHVQAEDDLGIASLNGSGKSTLFDAITRVPFPPSGGTVFLDGKQISHLPCNEIAKRSIVRTFLHESVFASFSAIEIVIVTAGQTRREGLRAAPGTGGARFGPGRVSGHAAQPDGRATARLSANTPDFGRRGLVRSDGAPARRARLRSDDSRDRADECADTLPERPGHNDPSGRTRAGWNFNSDVVMRCRMDPKTVGSAGLLHVPDGDLPFPEMMVEETLSVAAVAAREAVKRSRDWSRCKRSFHGLPSDWAASGRGTA